MLKFYCVECGESQPVDIEPISISGRYPDDGPWGNIFCQECRFVIATMGADVEGELRFVKSDFETLLDAAEQALTGVNFETRVVENYRN
jgi:hypothetical protein